MSKIEYDIDPRERIQVPDKDGKLVDGLVLKKVTGTKRPEVKKLKSAIKEEVITGSILDRDDQLNLIATLIEQIGTKVGLNTPEFMHAKAKFAEIKSVLQG